MYRVLPDDERLGFGDVLEAPWLFDLYLREDSRAVGPTTIEGKNVLVRMEEPEERGNRKDIVAASTDPEFAIGHGNSRRAIILTDDCEMESLQGRGHGSPSGRILMAAIRDATDEAAKTVPRLKFSQFSLPAHDEAGFLAGLVVFENVFAVHISALVNKQPERAYRRMISLDHVGQRDLSRKWCAHGTRHGPIVVEAEARKFAKLLEANGDTAVAALLDSTDEATRIEPADEHQKVVVAIVAASTAMWQLEGPVLDRVAADWDDRKTSEDVQRRIVSALRSLRQAADNGLGLLGEDRWGPGGEVPPDPL